MTKTERNTKKYIKIAIIPQKASLGFSSKLHSQRGACCRLIIIRNCPGILQRLPSFSAVYARRTTREPGRENRERECTKELFQDMPGTRLQHSGTENKKKPCVLKLLSFSIRLANVFSNLNTDVVWNGIEFKIWFTAN